MEASSHPRQCPDQGPGANEPPLLFKYSDVSSSPVKEDLDHDISVDAPTASKEDTQPLTAPERDLPKLTPEEEEGMFRALKAIFEDIDGDKAGVDVRQLLASLELADKEVAPDGPNTEVLEDVKTKVYHLWRSRSSYMARVTEILANGSRDSKWRLPYGKTGVLDLYLRIIATRDVEDDILLHALRLIGNSCADTDENRRQVVNGNYTLPIMRLFNNPALAHVAIPVIYNICVDFVEPAQKQVAGNRIAYPILRLLANGSIKGNSLLNYAYELVEIASEQAQAMDQTSEDSLSMIITLASNSDIALHHFTSIVNSLAAYLQRDKFQQICILQQRVEPVLSILFRSYEMADDEASSDDKQALSTCRLKLNHALSDLSALPMYSRTYPLSSAVTKTLISWLKTSKDHLLICACVMLGNLAREDAVCESMVENFQVHISLIAILNGGASNTVLHSALAFLKNLSIAGKNREHLGAAGIIKTLSKLWGAETVPQLQFMAASLTRQVVLSSVGNITRLLEVLSPDPNSPANARTYLSLLLSLFAKTDSPPTRTEIGRTIAAICRVLLRLNANSEASNATETLVKRLFSLHEEVARPIGAMIVQSEWPIVRSEGWFALALMASYPESCVAVSDCLQSVTVTELLCEAVRQKISEPSDGEAVQEKAERVRQAKDRDNTLILLHNLLKHSPPTLTPARKQMFENLLHEVGQARSQ
ncbi:hypothetical protein PRK78_004862 [Emydomyces testavorans]|uniref:GTP binding protein n=1 Tax=Emydomyces testavorans TaxID=2070801 RepID=A0AAF0DKZ5_9EURO|nr:hypothetical protein PRK78_004862 [Emydomyces testavorans]